MALVRYAEPLKNEYRELFDSCRINPDKLRIIENIIIKIQANKSRYTSVADNLGIPWYVVAVIHYMESSLNFNTHLHNGDSLMRRTIHVPSGRPVDGNPPFSWEESAYDALRLKQMHKWKDWSICGILYKLEEYNGWGYRKSHPYVYSPYLWSFSDKYTRGKYTADGIWSDEEVSNQCGAAVLLRRMAEKNMITAEKVTGFAPPLFFSSERIEFAEELQIFLNNFPGIYLLVDGKPGEKTSAAFKAVTGYYLKGDPRIIPNEMKKETA